MICIGFVQNNGITHFNDNVYNTLHLLSCRHRSLNSEEILNKVLG